jgi:thiamine biosynthesis lipoprotein ApbE
LKALSGEKCEKRLHRSPKFSTLSVISDTAVVCDALSTGLVYADDRLIQKVVSSSEQSIEIIGLRMDGQKVHWKTA